MFKYTTAFILLFCSSVAQADHWFCTDEATERTDNVIKSCGIGTAKREEDARRRALKSAANEFWQVCNLSSDCIYHLVYLKPLRTECLKEDDLYKCYRILEFTIGEPVNK
jgi:hypothetical protein